MGEAVLDGIYPARSQICERMGIYRPPSRSRASLVHPAVEPTVQLDTLPPLVQDVSLAGHDYDDVAVRPLLSALASRRVWGFAASRMARFVYLVENGVCSFQDHESLARSRRG